VGGIACGAATGPRVPCETPLAGTQSVVVFVPDHGVATDGFFSRDGRTWEQTQFDLFDRVLPAIDDAVLMGAVVFARPHAPQSCAAADALGVPIGAHHAAAVRQYLRDIGGAAGSSPIIATLEVAVTALRRAGGAQTPRYLVVTWHGGWDCDSDPPRIAERLRAYRAEGIRTLVIGFTSRGALPEDTPVVSLNMIADGGGLAATPGPWRFYDATDADAIEAAFTRIFRRPYACELRAADTSSLQDRAALRSRRAGAIARDPARENGWDWVDRANDRLDLFGTVCDEAARQTDNFILVTSENLCSP
jgi:hypothetical protein